jgi:putative flavoprotein involved in K+ transport
VHGPAGELRAGMVVIAAGPFRAPRLPACAAALSNRVWQRHSSGYRNPSDVPEGSVLVVGGGNSAAQLADELHRTHPVVLASSRSPVFSPSSILGLSIFCYMHGTGMLRTDRDSVISRYAREYDDAILGYRVRRLIQRGEISHIPYGVTDARDERVRLANDLELVVKNVLWCTGFRAEYEWVAIDGALNTDGTPRQKRGISPIPGLYWLGLPWQNRLDSALICGVAADARDLGYRIASARRTGPRASSRTVGGRPARI